MKKSILIVYGEMIIGGSTTSLLSLLNEINYEKYDVDLILYKNEGPLLSEIPIQVNLLEPACKYQGRNTYFIRVWKAFVSGYLFKAFRNSIKYKKRLGFLTQTMMDARVDCYSRKLKNEYELAIGYIEGWPDKYVASDKIKAKRKIGWIHLDYEKSYLVPELDLKSFQIFDTVVSVSTVCEENNRKTFGFKSSLYLPNILSDKYVINRSLITPESDEEYISWRKDNRVKIITVCRLVNIHKGVDRAVKTAAELKRRGLKFNWIVIGEGQDKEIIQQMIENGDLQDCFRVIGARVNPLPFERVADLFVLPSRYEGKPMAVTEAQILSIPPIVTEYASAREQIANGLDGIIVPNKDFALVNPLTELISKPEKIENLKKELIKRIYGNSSDIKFYEELFDNCERKSAI